MYGSYHAHDGVEFISLRHRSAAEALVHSAKVFLLDHIRDMPGLLIVALIVLAFGFSMKFFAPKLFSACLSKIARFKYIRFFLRKKNQRPIALKAKPEIILNDEALLKEILGEFYRRVKIFGVSLGLSLSVLFILCFLMQDVALASFNTTYTASISQFSDIEDLIGSRLAYIDAVSGDLEPMARELYQLIPQLTSEPELVTLDFGLQQLLDGEIDTLLSTKFSRKVATLRSSEADPINVRDYGRNQLWRDGFQISGIQN